MKHKNEKPQGSAPVARAWSPEWPLSSQPSELDRLFEESFDQWLAPPGTFLETWLPAIDVFEDTANIVLTAELPGMKKDEIEIFLSGESLHIAGERKEKAEHKSGQAHRVERYFGRFHRSVPLPMPVDADRIEARYQDGVLIITCPKSERAKPKQFQIKVD